MSPLIFASCRNCSSNLASAETIHDLLLPAETSVLGKLLPTETLGRKQNHTNSLCRKPFFVDGSLGRKQEITESLSGSQI